MATTPTPTPLSQATAATPQPKPGTLLTLILAVFLLRTFAWASAELWYDEVLTLQRFILPHLGEPSAILRDYPIANNHLLFTLVEAWWLRVLGGLFDEYLLRLPSLLFGLATVATVLLHWRRLLGLRVAALGALTLAISPVFTAYAYQMRGYSLSLLLATLAISGLLELLPAAEGDAPPRTALGSALLGATGLALPLVMPTNLLFAPVLATLGWLLLRRDGQRPTTALLKLLPWCVGTLLGAAYYLTILDQVRRALAEPDGWNSAWLVAGNLLLGVAVHLGAPLVLTLLCAWRQGRAAAWPALRPLLWGAASLTLVTALGLALSRSGHAPFPRVFLVLLPAATLLPLLACRWLDADQKPRLLLNTALAALVCGILVERLAEGVTDTQLKRGIIPDNLLQQYYRGAEDLREIAENESLAASEATVLTDAYDMMSASFYLGLHRKPDVQGLVVGSPMLETASAWLPRTPGRRLAIAPDAAAARDLFRRAGLPHGELRELYRARSARRAVFELK